MEFVPVSAQNPTHFLLPPRTKAEPFFCWETTSSHRLILLGGKCVASRAKQKVPLRRSERRKTATQVLARTENPRAVIIIITGMSDIQHNKRKRLVDLCCCGHSIVLSLPLRDVKWECNGESSAAHTHPEKRMSMRFLQQKNKATRAHFSQQTTPVGNIPVSYVHPDGSRSNK